MTDDGVIEIIGCLWRKDGRVYFSARISERIVYLAIPQLEQVVQLQAAARGITVGDMCDIINAHMSEYERERRRASGDLSGEITFQLDENQTDAMKALFFGETP